MQNEQTDYIEIWDKTSVELWLSRMEPLSNNNEIKEMMIEENIDGKRLISLESEEITPGLRTVDQYIEDQEVKEIFLVSIRQLKEQYENYDLQYALNIHEEDTQDMMLSLNSEKKKDISNVHRAYIESYRKVLIQERKNISQKKIVLENYQKVIPHHYKILSDELQDLLNEENDDDSDTNSDLNQEMYPNIIQECASCQDKTQYTYKLDCKHIQCNKCLTRMSVSQQPVKCCNADVPISILKEAMDKEDFEKQRSKMLNKNRCVIECPNEDCNEIMDKLKLVTKRKRNKKQYATCPKCETSICQACCKKEHNGHCVDLVKQEKQTLALTKNLGYKQCPSCKQIIEKSEGCNHMTCRDCTEEFCQKCGSIWLDKYRKRLCNCDLFEDVSESEDDEEDNGPLFVDDWWNRHRQRFR